MPWKEEFKHKRFDRHFTKLQSFMEKNDHWPVQRNTEGLEHELAVWFLSLRGKYKNNLLVKNDPTKLTEVKNNLLSDYEIKKLEKIGFPFKPFDHRWSETYELLKKHIKKHHAFPDHKNRLYSWLHRQFYIWKKLDDWQHKALREIGVGKFIDMIEEHGTLKNSYWEVKFKKVQEYYKEHKKLPTVQEDQELGIWCSNQRAIYRKNNLSADKLEKLKGVGFLPFIDRDRKWIAVYTQLAEYLKNNNGVWPTSGYLNGWCSYNRSWYNKKLDTYGEYPEERKKKLDTLGFRWEQ